MSDDDDIDLGQGEESDDKPLEEKYAEQMRQIFPQKIELPLSTIISMIKEQIELSPKFQRREVWDQKKQSKFIESLIMNVPIPPIFMGEDEYSKYVVLDGRQRLTAINNFLGNEYELQGLKVWSSLNGKRYSDLKTDKLHVAITRRFLPAVVLLKESSPEVKYDVFERLNTGGLNLKPMEIRNAIYRGPLTDLLHVCAEQTTFRKLWGIPMNEGRRKTDLTYQRMGDLELVLRFFALGDAQGKEGTRRPAFKIYLGKYLQEQNKALKSDEAAINAMRARFEKATENCLKILGPNAFLPAGKNKKGGRKKRSAPLADALMYGFSNVDWDGGDSAIHQDSIKDAIVDLQMSNPTFMDSMESATNGRAKIETRLNEARIAIEAALKTVT